MKAVWLKGHKDREQRRQELLSYRNAFGELKSLLEREYKKEPCNRDYSDPNWVYNQIAYNEYNAGLKDIFSLLELDKDQE